jgi:arylsulfatase A-like enzyme/Tfp pilus assembly protein PilF
MGKKPKPRAAAAKPAPSRRPLPLVLAAVAIVLAAAAGWWWFAHRATPVVFAKTPEQNVLLITLDTMRADGLSCYGGRAATPNLDGLAALGVRYDFAHAHAVMTLVSHASILTGLYPFQHAVHDNAGFRLPAATPTLATLLRRHGVSTGAFIASFALDSRFGLNAGFDVYDERYGKSQMNSGFLMPERRGDAVVAAATAWIGQQRGRWFAWAHLFDPHAPYDPPPPFKEQYADRPYYGEVAFTDSTLGRLLDAARDPSGRPTLVIVTGDHGEGLGDHGEMTHGLFAYESTLRIPLIVAQIDRRTPSWTGTAGGPAATAGPHVSSAPVRHVDIVPTILDALQVARPKGLPGRSLLAAAAPDAGQTASYFEAMSASFNRGWAPLTGVLAGREKYLALPLPERYDLSQDPGEQANVVARDPARQRALEARLRAFGPVAVPGRQQEDPDAQSRLRALGYVSGHAALKARYTEEDDPKRLIELDQILRRAVELYERRRPTEAIPLYQQVIARRPAMEVTYTQLAMLYWDLGDPQSAIGTLQRARQAGVDSTELRTKLGMYLAESGNVAQAVPLLREASAGTFPDLDALNALGIALARSGRPDEAAATFNRILQLDASNAMALENLGTIALERGQMDQARTHLRRALEVDPASPQAHNTMGVVEQKAGNRKAAIEHWKQAVAGDAGNFDALYNLALELTNDGDLPAARPYLERFARTAPPAFYARDIARVRELLAKAAR